ncbi:MAG: T9SS type A sorting domain-containing protein [Bacteroidota bacterium]
MLTQTSGMTANIAEKERLIKDDKVAEILKEADVYPNPAEDHIFLKIRDFESLSDVKIEVMSIIGNKMTVTHETVKPGLYKIDLTNIPVGHYYVMLTIDSEKSLKKFLKK